jgi:hypothetical protein
MTDFGRRLAAMERAHGVLHRLVRDHEADVLPQVLLPRAD